MRLRRPSGFIGETSPDLGEQRPWWRIRLEVRTALTRSLDEEGVSYE
jgi:hypothetical protein